MYYVNKRSSNQKLLYQMFLKLKETERARQEALEAADAARKELEGEGKFYVTFCLL
jgi:ribosomal protein L16/L10AE